MTKEEMDELRRLCKAATPGNRTTFCRGTGRLQTGTALYFSAVGQGVQTDHEGGSSPAADDRYHAALSPSVTLRLLDALVEAVEESERLRGEVERVRDHAENDLGALRQRLVDEHDGHSAREEAVSWERQCHAAETAALEAELILEDAREALAAWAVSSSDGLIGRINRFLARSRRGHEDGDQ